MTNPDREIACVGYLVEVLRLHPPARAARILAAACVLLHLDELVDDLVKRARFLEEKDRERSAGT